MKLSSLWLTVMLVPFTALGQSTGGLPALREELAAEVAARAAGDAQLQANINTAQTSLNGEAAARQGADEALQANIMAETNARAAADNAETAARIAADAATLAAAKTYADTRPGPKGDKGDPGQSVTATALPTGDVNCPYGGSSFVGASGTTYACNGAPGLPPGIDLSRFPVRLYRAGGLIAVFSEMDGIGSETTYEELPGMPVQIQFREFARWTDIVLRRGVEVNQLALTNWLSEVRAAATGQGPDPRDSAAIEVLDEAQQVVARWTFQTGGPPGGHGAFPSAVTLALGGHESYVPIEEVTLLHDGLVRDTTFPAPPPPPGTYRFVLTVNRPGEAEQQQMVFRSGRGGGTSFTVARVVIPGLITAALQLVSYRFNDILLECGGPCPQAALAWRAQVDAGAVPLKQGTLKMLSPQGLTIAEWTLTDVLPTRIVMRASGTTRSEEIVLRVIGDALRIR
jgi:hypothetical protein